MPSSSLILYEFSRGKVEALDFKQFLQLFMPAGLNAPRIREARNRLVLCISGWDEDPRELYLIPEVRRFYRSLHHRWPYSLFFLNLHHNSLRILAFCCLENITAISVDGRAESGVQVDPVTGTVPVKIFSRHESRLRIGWAVRRRNLSAPMPVRRRGR